MNKHTKRAFKKPLATLMAVVMILGMLPVGALATVGNTAGIVPMNTFLDNARGLEKGAAIANKVVTPAATPGTFDVELYVAGKNDTTTTTAAYGADIVFVIDTSGSMTSNDITNARTSFASAVDALFNKPGVGEKSRVALVVFNDGVTIANFNQGGTGGARNWTTKGTWEADKTKLTSMWGTQNRTNTQAGIHAGHYLLKSVGQYNGVDNTKVMIVMTDGAPNKYYNGTETDKTVEFATGKRVIQSTVAPFTSGTWLPSSGASADGDNASADRAIWQAQYAAQDGVSIYAIGYGNKFTIVDGQLSGSTVATKTLKGISNKFFTAVGGAVNALTDVMNGIVTTATTPLNEVMVTDLIGNGFALNGLMGTPQQAAIPASGGIAENAWANVPGVTNKVDLVGSTVSWNLGTVADSTLYRVKFQVKLTATEPGTYYTNKNASGNFTKDGSNAGYQDGTHNKLTYKYNQTAKSFNIYACEAVTIAPATYTVTVNYHVKDTGGSYAKVNSLTKVKGDYANGAPYTFANVEASVPDSIAHGGKNYYFESGVNGSTLTSITDNTLYASLEGAISGANVEINLYYTEIGLPDIPLTKNITTATDATYPDNYTFNFALYTKAAGEVFTKVAELAFAKTEIGAPKNFVWALPAGLDVASLRDQKLYIHEVSVAKWSSSVMGQYVEYGTLTHLVGFTPATGFENKTVTNTYTQDFESPTIELHKFFVGDSSQLLPGHDGSDLVCKNEQKYVPEVREWVGHKHGSDCYEGEQLICTLEEGKEEITPAIEAHTHGDDCYEYNFTFKLYAGTTLLDTQTLTLTYGELKAIMADASLFKTVTFGPIAQSDIPQGGILTIVEEHSNYKWVASDAGSIAVDAYGQVTYPNDLGHAVITNTFGGIRIPGFSFAKTVLDARSILGASIANYYSGDFTFGLYDGETLVDTVTLTAVKGVALGQFELPQYVGETKTLKLREIIPEPKVEGMTYDTREFTIKIENDEVKGLFPAFVNTLFKPIDPVVTVNKNVNTTNGYDRATFTFNWSYLGTANEDPFKPVYDSGSKNITIGERTTESFTINLPRNFSGVLTIVEQGAGEGMENWVFDANKTRTIEYFLGEPVGRNASNTVSFTNNYYAPAIGLTKTASAESIVLGESVTYTITVTNTGSEELKNVVITDARFNGSVSVAPAGEGAPNLVKDTDYTLEAGTLTLTNPLKPGEKVFITYNVKPEATGKIENTATVVGQDEKGKTVTDTDTTTVNVTEHASTLVVSKQVTAYRTDMNFEGQGVVWQESVSFNSAGNRAAFKVTISNNGQYALYITAITDLFGSQNLENAVFFYDNGEGLSEHVGLASLLEAIGNTKLYRGDGEIVFYFITNALNSRGTLTNTVTVEASDDLQRKHEGSDSASVVVSWSDDDDDDDDNPPIDEPEEEEIPETDIPLIDLPTNPNPEPEPEPEIEVVVEETPLDDLPKTGGGGTVLPIVGMGLSSLGIGILLKGKRKED